MKKNFIKITIIIFFIVVLVVVGYFIWDYFGAEESDKTSQTQNQDARTAEVIDPGIFSSVPIIAVDAENNPHIIAYETTNQDLRYSTKVDGKWKSETVDAEGNVGDGHDIAIDHNGNPHISYRDITNGSIKYAKKIEESWETQTLDSPDKNDHIDASSIAIDSHGNPHIAYSMSKAAYIKYAYWDGDSWNIETPGITSNFISIALDSNDNPHITTLTNEPDVSHVKYATKLSDGNWKEEVVDPQTSVKYDPFIAIDSKDYPHIAFREASSGFIKYASYNGNSWEIQTVKEKKCEIGAGSQLDLALDQDDKPHLIFALPGEGLVLAVMDKGQWSYEVVGPSRVCTIAVDQLNQNHIAYTTDEENGQDNEKDNDQVLGEEDTIDDGEGKVIETDQGDQEEGTKKESGPITSQEIIKYIFVK